MEKKTPLVGLTSEQVEASRKAHGSNVLTPRERTPWWRKFAEKFKDPLIIILIVAAVLSIGISCYEFFGLNAGPTAFFEPVGILVAIFLAFGLSGRPTANSHYLINRMTKSLCASYATVMRPWFCVLNLS